MPVKSASNTVEIVSNVIEMLRTPLRWLRTSLNCFRTSLRWLRTPLNCFRTSLRWFRMPLNCFRTSLRCFATGLINNLCGSVQQTVSGGLLVGIKTMLNHNDKPSHHPTMGQAPVFPISARFCFHFAPIRHNPSTIQSTVFFSILF